MAASRAAWGSMPAREWMPMTSTEEKEWPHKESRHRCYADLLWQEYFRDPSQWWDNRNSKVGSAQCADFKHKVTKESLWIHGCHTPSWVGEELRSRGLVLSAQAPRGELCKRNHEVVHDRRSAFVASPDLQAGETINKVVRDEDASFVTLLKACTKNKDLHRGTRLHDDILKRGLLEKCADALVIMYAKCGALAKARTLLDMHKSRDVISWTALIAGYARERKSQDALKCYEHMQCEGIRPDAVTYICILKACGTIGAAEKGIQIHDEIARQGLLQNNIMLGNALVDMYVKCGALSKAQCVLEELPSRDVVSWNTLIAGYAQQGQFEQAMDCFEHMRREGIHPNVISWSTLIAGYAEHGQGEQALNCFECMKCESIPPNGVTYACILKACGTIGAADKGKHIHDEIARQGLLRDDIVLGCALVDMYAKCGALEKAQSVLEELSFRDIVCWNALITGYAQHGQGEQALKCFEHMQHEGISPNAVTYACILKACGTIGAADKGILIHDEIVRKGLLQNDTVLGNALVDMYAKCGSLAKAQHVLEELPSRDVVSWNALIAGYAQQGQVEQALYCFECMQREGIPPNVVSWSTLIAGYAEHGKGEQALNFFERMQREGICPNAMTYACILKACGTIGASDQGKHIHDEIVKQGLLQGNIVLGSALVGMYAKCGALAKAQCVLEELPSRDVVSWNALIAGYAQQGQGEQALNCFERMQHEGIHPDAATFCCVLNVCSHLGLVEEGHMFFVNMSTKYGVKPDLEAYTCMIDLFGRAGHLEKAVRLIRELPSSDFSAIWHALLSACQKWGDAKVGRWAFDQAVKVDKRDGAAYALMANIYAAAGMQENAKSIEATRVENTAWKKPERSLWIDLSGDVES